METVFNIIPGPQEDTCCILLYGEIGSEGSVTAEGIVSRLMEAERHYRKIDVRINSVGGEVATGIAIFNALRQSKAEITIYIDCIAASTASFIAGCGRPVKMSRYARIMLHRPSGCSYGDASHLKNYIAQLEQVEDILCRIYAGRTGLSVEEIRTTYMDGQDHWLTAEEALSLGFVDEIYDDPQQTPVTDSLSPRERCRRYTARYLESVENLYKNMERITDRLMQRSAFSDCADEKAILNRIAEMESKAARHDAVAAERDMLKAQVADFRRKEQEAQQAAYDAEVDAARAEERIGADEVASFKALMRKDAENTRALIAARKPKRRILNTLVPASGPVAKTDQELLARRVAEVNASLEGH